MCMELVNSSPLTPPSFLIKRGNWAAFNISPDGIVNREVIKLLIKFLLRNVTHGNYVSLFL